MDPIEIHENRLCQDQPFIGQDLRGTNSLSDCPTHWRGAHHMVQAAAMVYRPFTANDGQVYYHAKDSYYCVRCSRNLVRYTIVGKFFVREVGNVKLAYWMSHYYTLAGEVNLAYAEEQKESRIYLDRAYTAPLGHPTFSTQAFSGETLRIRTLDVKMVDKKPACRKKKAPSRKRRTR